ncbi:hypothetical protein MKW98_014692 [Papaver atlanticum]|uniref:Uncharacterized protein n=1 Tax=Papaver atlanticum TaxID=357466 RepID=A0AAD4SHD8_9MAGN|nr:hypothetical protein MKW98_014692 [Papaver atlanticum]
MALGKKSNHSGFDRTLSSLASIKSLPALLLDQTTKPEQSLLQYQSHPKVQRQSYPAFEGIHVMSRPASLQTCINSNWDGFWVKFR